MTTKEKLVEMCVSRGMFENDANEVVGIATEEIDSLDDYKITWDRPASEYTDELYAEMFLTVRRVAVKWIDDNQPKAWFRELFN